MEPHDYTVDRIDGEYAYLKDENCNEVFIALALLPEGTDVGSRLHYEMMEYTIGEYYESGIFRQICFKSGRP